MHLGAQISDSKPKAPKWGSVAVGGDNPVTAVVAWGGQGGQVLLGDKEGWLHCWNTSSGAVHSLATNQVRHELPSVHLTRLSPDPNPQTLG